MPVKEIKSAEQKTIDAEAKAEAKIEAREEAAMEAESISLQSGFHVIADDGTSLGCYQSGVEALAFAEGHLIPQGIEFTIEAVV